VSLIRLFVRRCMAPEGDPAAGGGGGGGGGGTAQNPVLTLPDELIPEAWKDHVKELRKEHKKIRETEDARQAQADERVKKANEAAELKIKEASTAADQRVIRAELRAAAVKAGMVDLDGLKLADLSKVKLNDQGEVEGAEELMTALKKAKPYLFGEPSTSSTHRAPGPGENKPKKVSEMTDAERKAEAKSRGFTGF
jgi:hypothetical protein